MLNSTYISISNPNQDDSRNVNLNDLIKEKKLDFYKKKNNNWGFWSKVIIAHFFQLTKKPLISVI
jgi:hypothetical protein